MTAWSATFLKLVDDLGIANDTIVFYSTDNGPHYNAWPDAGTTPFRSEKNSNWEGAYRVPAFVRWPGKFLAGKTLNGLVSHEDWMVTFLTAAGMPDVKERLMKGDTFAGRKYRAHPDGYNMLDYFSGKVKDSPRKEFWYVSDDGQIVAARWQDWKVVFLENRGQAFGVWREPILNCGCLYCSTCAAIRSRRPQHNSNTYNDWFLDRAFVLVPIQNSGSEVPYDDEGLPAEPDAWVLQFEQDRGETQASTLRTVMATARRAVAICCGRMRIRLITTPASRRSERASAALLNGPCTNTEELRSIRKCNGQPVGYAMSFRLTLTTWVMLMIGLLAALLIFVQLRTLNLAVQGSATSTMDAASKNAVSMLQYQVEMLSRATRAVAFSPSIISSPEPDEKQSLRQPAQEQPYSVACDG